MTIKEIRAKYGSRCDYIVVDASGWAWDGFNEDHWNAIGELGWCASDAEVEAAGIIKVECDADGIVTIYTANDFM
jgi:hypothetical protein